MAPFRIISRPAILLTLMLLLIAGCHDTTEPDPQNPEEDLRNSNSPNANALVTAQSVFGDPQKESTIWHMDGNMSDGFLCDGRDDNVLSASSLTSSGAENWHTPLAFQPRSILGVDVDRFTGMIVVGAHDSNDDGDKDEGIATLIGQDGVIRNQFTLSDPTAEVWYNAVEIVADSLFLCVGGARLNDTDYPLLSVLHIEPDATLRGGSYTILEEIPHDWFVDLEGRVVLVNTVTGETDVDCYVSGLNTDGEASKISICSLRCPTDNTADTHIYWSRDLVAYEGLSTSLTTGKTLSLANNGNVYVAGRTDVNKDPAPASGGYWSGGFIASISQDGTVNWTTPVILSEYSDYYISVFTTSEGLFAAGLYSGYKVSGQDFGYGLLSRFNLESGAAEYHLTIGADDYKSALNTLYVENTTAAVGGYTHQYTTDGGYQSWFATLDLSSPPPASLISRSPQSMRAVSTVRIDACRGGNQ